MSFRESLLDLLFPPRCPFCRGLLKEGEALACASCLKKLPYVSQQAQNKKLGNIEKCVAPFYYEGSLREALLRYKFSALTAYKKSFGFFLSKCIDESDVSCDIITWVPLSRRRLRRRGYDQAQLIAGAVSAELSIPCERLLRKTKDTKPQSSLNAAKRKSNASGVYAPVSPESIEGKKVLIIDDIVTTGSTLSECARVLKAAGAEKVYAAAVAKSRD